MSSHEKSAALNTDEYPGTLWVRHAVPSDAAGVAALHADSWRRHYRGAYADAYLDGDVVADRLAVWTPRLAVYADPAASPGSVTIVAEAADAADAADAAAADGTELSAFVHVVFDDDARWGSLVDNLHVTATRQRSGVGTVLLARAAQAAAEQAASERVYLWVLEQNTAARSFYAARGGECVETATVGDPGGVPGRLHGTPVKLRIAWPDAAALASSLSSVQTLSASPTLPTLPTLPTSPALSG